jgi:hypothetical protein
MLDTPDADKRTDETMDRMKDPGPAKSRQISAHEVAEESSDKHERARGADQHAVGDSENREGKPARAERCSGPVAPAGDVLLSG